MTCCVKQDVGVGVVWKGAAYPDPHPSSNPPPACPTFCLALVRRAEIDSGRRETRAEVRGLGRSSRVFSACELRAEQQL